MTCKQNRSPDTFIFSVGGTVVDSTTQYVAAWQRALADEPIAVSTLTLLSYVGLDEREICRNILGADSQVLRMRVQAELTIAGGLVAAYSEAANVLQHLEDTGVRVLLFVGPELRPVQHVIDENPDLAKYPIIRAVNQYTESSSASESFVPSTLRIEPESACFVSSSSWEVGAAAALGLKAVAVSRNGDNEMFRAAGATNLIFDITALYGFPMHAISCKKLGSFAYFV